jgi:REP element-mobilizing transposase RayT
MRVNDAGVMVQKWWHESAKKFKNLELDEFVIMPNHFYGIILIVGATLCGCPDICDRPEINAQPSTTGHTTEAGQPHRVAPTLGDFVDWFKTMTTNEYIRNVRQYNWPPFNGKFWQRNYYEHIIKNEKEMDRIRQYIIENPMKWAEDENNPVNICIDVASVHRRGMACHAPTEIQWPPNPSPSIPGRRRSCIWMLTRFLPHASRRYIRN